MHFYIKIIEESKVFLKQVSFSEAITLTLLMLFHLYPIIAIFFFWDLFLVLLEK